MSASAPATERYTSDALRGQSRHPVGEIDIPRGGPRPRLRSKLCRDLRRALRDRRGPGVSAPGPDRDRVLRYLGELREETMLLAWGAASHEERRRIVLAALIFGRQFEERAAQRLAESDEDGLRRFLMRLMNGVVEEFAACEGLHRDEAAAFLSEVSTRDHVLEFDEVLDAYADGRSGRSLDGLLRKAVDDRGEKAMRSRWGE